MVNTKCQHARYTSHLMHMAPLLRHISEFDGFPLIFVENERKNRKNRKNRKKSKKNKFFLKQAISIGNRLKKTLEKTSSYNIQPKKSCVGWKLGRSFRKNERKKSKKSKKIEKK